MTPPQRTLYWREWRKVQTIDPEADRHDLHQQALGIDKSSKELTNRDLDRILAVFRRITRPADLHAQLRAQDQPRIRLLWQIQRRQLPQLAALLGDRTAAATYLRTLLTTRFRATSVDDLDHQALTQLRYTLAARLTHLRHRAQPADPPDPSDPSDQPVQPDLFQACTSKS